MPTGIYTRTEKHSFNKGRRHLNRKPYFKGKGMRNKICLFCKLEFIPDWRNFQRTKFCSKSCSSKSRPSGRLGKPCPEKIKAILRSKTGDKHHNWKGGVSRGYKTGYYSTEYKQWRINVFKRDGYKCQNCGITGTYITAHHIKSFAHYPELRFDLPNGITLCEPCHSLTDNYKGRNRRTGKLK